MLSRKLKLRFVNKYIEVPKRLRAKPRHPGILSAGGDCLPIDLAQLTLDTSTLEQNKAMEKLHNIERRNYQGDGSEADENLVLNEREDFSSAPT